MGSAVTAQVAAKIVAWRAHPGFQRRAMRCPVREMLIGGAKGSGKTALIGPKAVKHVLKHGHLGATVLVLRETFGDLSEIIENTRALFRRAGGRYLKSEHTWRFPNGGRVKFGHLGDGCEKYWGHEYSLIIIDELTRCIATERDYLKLLGCLRNSRGVPVQAMSTSNPGGIGHAWVQARFKNVPPMQVQHDKKGLARVFLPGRLEDNPTLDPVDPVTGERTGEYRASMESWPEADRRAYLLGDWDAFTGQIFKLERGVHIWTWEQFNAHYKMDPANRTIPAEWFRFRSYDHGFARPGACYWYAVDPEGRAFVYRELYTIARDGNGDFIPDKGASLPPRDVAKAIREYSEGETFQANWSGPDLSAEVRQDQAGGVPISTHFAAEGIHFNAWDASQDSRVAGKQALHQRLAYTRNAQGEVEIWPALVILDGAAPHLVRTLTALEYSQQRPEIWDKTSEDHAADSVCGFCKMRPWGPEPKAKPKPTGWRERRRSGKKRDWMTGRSA